MRKGRKSPSMAGRPKTKKKIGRKILAVLVLISAAFLVYKTVDFGPALEQLTANSNQADSTSEVTIEIQASPVISQEEEVVDTVTSEVGDTTSISYYEQISNFVQTQFNKFFEVKSFSIKGVNSVVEDSLTADLDTVIGLPILELDLFGIAASFEKHPRIKDASVRRILPGTLQICVEERVEEALVVCNNKLFGVDSDNVVMSEPKPGWVQDRPIITGYSGELIPGDKVEDEVVLKAIEWVRQSNLNPGVLGWISEINIQNGRIETLMGNDGWEVKPGTHDLKKQIATMETFLAEVENRQNKSGSVDLRFPDFLIVKRGS